MLQAALVFNAEGYNSVADRAFARSMRPGGQLSLKMDVFGDFRTFGQSVSSVWNGFLEGHWAACLGPSRLVRLDERLGALSLNVIAFAASAARAARSASR